MLVRSLKTRPVGFWPLISTRVPGGKTSPPSPIQADPLALHPRKTRDDTSFVYFGIKFRPIRIVGAPVWVRVCATEAVRTNGILGASSNPAPFVRAVSATQSAAGSELSVSWNAEREDEGYGAGLNVLAIPLLASGN